MSEEERRRFALEQEPAAAADAETATEELDFHEPRRDHERTKADLEDRDGTAALVDDAEHVRGVREQTREQDRQPRDRT